MSASSFRTVLLLTPVILTIELIEFPSTRAEMICPRFVAESLFTKLSICLLGQECQVGNSYVLGVVVNFYEDLSYKAAAD